MKEVSSSTWSFQIIIFFILIFACFLILTINYNKAYGVKNKLLTIVEKYEGINCSTAQIIDSYLSNKAYATVGKCPDDGNTWYGASSGGAISLADENTKYLYCFSETTVKKSSSTLVYYNVVAFYKFYLPVIGDIATYEISGKTKNFVGSTDRVTYNGGSC